MNLGQNMLKVNGYGLICSTVRHFVEELRSAVPHVLELIDKGIIEKKVFDYPEFNNGCEIIP